MSTVVIFFHHLISASQSSSKTFYWLLKLLQLDIVVCSACPLFRCKYLHGFHHKSCCLPLSFCLCMSQSCGVCIDIIPVWKDSFALVSSLKSWQDPLKCGLASLTVLNHDCYSKEQSISGGWWMHPGQSVTAWNQFIKHITAHKYAFQQKKYWF